MGPMVWELDGPGPVLKMSKIDVVMQWSGFIYLFIFLGVKSAMARPPVDNNCLKIIGNAMEVKRYFDGGNRLTPGYRILIFFQG